MLSNLLDGFVTMLENAGPSLSFQPPIARLTRLTLDLGESFSAITRLKKSEEMVTVDFRAVTMILMNFHD